MNKEDGRTTREIDRQRDSSILRSMDKKPERGLVGLEKDVDSDKDSHMCFTGVLICSSASCWF